ncbi:efflux pump antibiotic resistance protein [Sclerotinia borealis F-4128]|uniref:Efflux pump antibiotic resistance protein n=1 Tax=Sclerotinia borealis (strain F-4128) TaxID=1432307 RepID=W9C8X9_SCLBF|nr:efflux pump antibiotic resistance protein [Sclerotinia borealis F-4128]
MALTSMNDERTPLLSGAKCSAVTTYGGPLSIRGDEEFAPCKIPLVDPSPSSRNSRNIAGVISILLLGVFIANADGSLVLATSGTISSEFNDLGNAEWLISSYTLAMCATQSLYGKLSDIYGRKSTILASYVFFAVGSVICGLGWNLPTVVVGRLVAGVGGAGINCLVSIVIADMVPIREVAKWRSYVNIAATTGRSLGGPIGGFLTDTIGWRWSFLGQCPPTILALILVMWKLEISPQQVSDKQTHFSKLCRIDFLGSIFLSVSIVCGLVVLDLGGHRMPWTDLKFLSLLGVSIAAGILFFLVEGFWAKEPIFPLRLLRNRDVLTSYINLGFQSGAQISMMMLVPIYFQITDHASFTTAGAHLMPSVLGNALGGLLAGYIIYKTGTYKPILLLGALSSTTSYILLLTRWHGHTSFLESLYIIPGGFGNGIALSATFIGLTAGVEQEELAIASSGLFLSANIGTVVGLTVAGSVMEGGLEKGLRVALEGWEGRERVGGLLSLVSSCLEIFKDCYAMQMFQLLTQLHTSQIIERALSDIEYVRALDGKLGELVTNVYVNCLSNTHAVSVFAALVALIAACCVRQHRL